MTPTNSELREDIIEAMIADPKVWLDTDLNGDLIEPNVDAIIDLFDQHLDKQVIEARITECEEIANTIAFNKKGIHPDLPLTANQIEEWIGQRLRNYIQNGAQDTLLATLKDTLKDKEK